MAFVPLTLGDPLHHNLTEKYCLDNDIQPWIYGDTVSFRFQVRDYDDVAVSLSGASIVATFTIRSTSITRSTATLITGSTYQIKIDTDQSTETGYTGKGWYQLNFLASETSFSALQYNRVNYSIRITLGDGSVFTHVKGVIDVL
jgi:hypothetical protein